MLIHCHGARGSVPVSGAAYQKYGGDTSCIELVSEKGTRLIIDAGTGIRALGNTLIRSKFEPLHLLFTHLHWDHVQGFPFFQPIFGDYEIHIHGPVLNGISIEQNFKRIMDPPFFPFPFDALKARFVFYQISGQLFRIEDFEIMPIPLNHPGGGFGYRISENGHALVFLTDNELGYTHSEGLTPAYYAEMIRDTDILIHDAQYNRSEYAQSAGYGHSNADEALLLAKTAGVKRLGLFHHNYNRTDRQIDEMVKEFGKQLRDAGSELDCFAMRPDFCLRF